MTALTLDGKAAAAAARTDSDAVHDAGSPGEPDAL